MPAIAMPTARPIDALLGQARVEHAVDAELFLQSLGDEVHAALHADVLAKHDDLWIALQLGAQRAPNRVGEAKHLAFFGRSVRSTQRRDFGGAESAHCLGVARFSRFRIDETLDLVGDRSGTRAGALQRRAYIVRDFTFEFLPVLV